MGGLIADPGDRSKLSAKDIAVRVPFILVWQKIACSPNGELHAIAHMSASAGIFK